MVSYFPASYAQVTWARLAPFFALTGQVRADASSVQVELGWFNDRRLNWDLAEVCRRVNAAWPRLPDRRRLLFRLAGGTV